MADSQFPLLENKAFTALLLEKNLLSISPDLLTNSIKFLTEILTSFTINPFYYLESYSKSKKSSCLRASNKIIFAEFDKLRLLPKSFNMGILMAFS